MRATIGKVYLLLGRDVEGSVKLNIKILTSISCTIGFISEISCAPAGNVVGIGGLEDFILKSATLSTDWACPPFVESSSASVPILRVAVEPAKSSDLSKLVHGLHLLNQVKDLVKIARALPIQSNANYELLLGRCKCPCKYDRPGRTCPRHSWRSSFGKVFKRSQRNIRWDRSCCIWASRPLPWDNSQTPWNWYGQWRVKRGK